jgi:hypothetical protein
MKEYLSLSHGLREADKIPFRELESAADAFRDGLGNVIRLGVPGFRVLSRL